MRSQIWPGIACQAGMKANKRQASMASFISQKSPFVAALQGHNFISRWPQLKANNICFYSISRYLNIRVARLPRLFRNMIQTVAISFALFSNTNIFFVQNRGKVCCPLFFVPLGFEGSLFFFKKCFIYFHPQPSSHRRYCYCAACAFAHSLLIFCATLFLYLCGW